MTLTKNAYSLGISIEIGIHIAVVIAVYIPILVIVFPAALVLTGAIMTASFAPDSNIALWLSSDPLGPLTASLGIVLLIAITSVVIYRFRNKKQSERLKRLTGADGEKLDQLVSEMWAKISDGPAPDVRWFPRFDIAGYAALHSGRPQLQVSAGLWQAAVSGNDTAKAILAHELAHIRNNDPQTLKAIDIVRFTAANILSFVAVISLIVFCAVFASEVSSAFAERGMDSALFRALLVIVGALMVLVVFPLSWLALRRHIGFIHSLLEIRADIDAALWTEGRENFTQAFASSKSVRRTGRRELVAALLSSKLSHIPERERLQILRSPALLVTPKVSFFALSALLAVALPLNFGSGLFLGGALNHLVAQGAAVAFNMALIGALCAGQTKDRVHISFARIAVLALASILVTALPRINLEPISYLIMGWTLGFGGAPADISTLSQSLSITLQDLFGKLTATILNGAAAISFIVAATALKGFAAASAKPSTLPTKLRIGVAMLAAMLGSVLAGFDPFRSLAPSLIPNIADWLESNEIEYSILLFVPIALPFLVDTFFVAIGHLTREKHTHRLR